MKKARTLITRAAVVAVVLVGLSAQAASASSGSSKGDRGRSCWAQSRHKAHKHATGHDHRCDHDHDRDDHDDDDRDDVTPTTTIPTTTTVPRPASSESASPATGSSPSTSVAISPRIGGEIVVIEEPAATEPARENAEVTPGIGVGESSTPTTTTPQAMPSNESSSSVGSDTALEADQVATPEIDQPAVQPSSDVAGEPEGSLMLTDAQLSESMRLATSQVRQQATMQFWWVLLVLLAVALETARRVRRNGASDASDAK